MPKYIAITPTFTPYSVDELMKVPLQIAAEAKEQEKIYNDQMDKLAAIEAMAGDNSELREYMSPYYEARDKAVEAMSSGNYDPNIASVNRNLRNIWRDRGLKAEAGIGAYSAYQKARPQDAIGGNHSLMEFINNPTLQADYVSGDRIEKSSAEIISKLAASLPPSQRGTFLGNSQYLISQGYSIDEIMNAMGGDNSLLGQSIANIRSQYGYDNMTDVNDKAAIDKRILAGAMSGLERYSTASNPYFVGPSRRGSSSSLSTPKEDKGWTHVLGTPIGEEGEVQIKRNSDGSATRRKRNAGGGWDDDGYDPAPAKQKSTTTKSSSSSNKKNKTIIKVHDNRFIGSDSSTPVTKSEDVKEVTSLIDSGKLVEVSMDELRDDAARDAVRKEVPAIVDNPDGFKIYKYRSGNKKDFYVIPTDDVSDDTEQESVQISSGNPYISTSEDDNEVDND